MKITIDHSPEFQEKLFAVLKALEKEYRKLERIEVIPSDKGIFRISLNGKVILDLEKDKFSIQTVLDAVNTEKAQEAKEK